MKQNRKQVTGCRQVQM